eukprot:2617331-Rhodomonas_salina.2
MVLRAWLRLESSGLLQEYARVKQYPSAGVDCGGTAVPSHTAEYADYVYARTESIAWSFFGRQGRDLFVGFRQPHSFNVVKFDLDEKTHVLEACKVSSASPDSATDAFSTGSGPQRTTFCTGWADGALLIDACVWNDAGEGAKKSHVRVWDIAAGFDLDDGRAVQLEITDKRVYDVAVAPGGARLAMRMWDGSVQVWSIVAEPSKQELGNSSPRPSWAYAPRIGDTFVWSPDGQWLA